MDALVDLVRDGLFSAVIWALPLLAAALVASIVSGFLAARLGLADPALGLVMRAACVVLALWLVAGSIGADARGLAADAFARLPSLGRGGP